MADEKPSSRYLADDPAYWRSRAGQMREAAKGMPDAHSRQIMNDIAESYDRLAERAEIRTDGGKRPRRGETENT